MTKLISLLSLLTYITYYIVNVIHYYMGGYMMVVVLSFVLLPISPLSSDL